MGKKIKKLKRIQAVAAGTLTLSMVMGAAFPALAAEASAGTTVYSSVSGSSRSVTTGAGREMVVFSLQEIF